MSINPIRSAYEIILGSLAFSISAYEIIHDKRIKQNNMITGECSLCNQGANPFTLRLDGCFSKADTDTAVVLESIFSENASYDFTVGDMVFTSMILKSYGFSEDIHKTFNRCELVFICSESFGGADYDSDAYTD